MQRRWPSLCNLALWKELLTLGSQRWSDWGQRADEINFLCGRRRCGTWDRICLLEVSRLQFKWIVGADDARARDLTRFHVFNHFPGLCVLQRRSGRQAAPVSKPQFYGWQEGATENIPMVDTEGAPDMWPPILKNDLYVFFLNPSQNCCNVLLFSVRLLQKLK